MKAKTARTYLHLLVIVLACVLTTCSACTCLFLPFKKHYAQADSVVRAKVLSVTRYAPGCTGKACLIPPGPFFGNLLVKFKLQRKFKNCGPPTKIFFGKTASQSAACGVSFQTGRSYMLNLPKPTFVRRLGEPTRFYMLNICQSHRLWSGLSRNRKLLLKLCSLEPENQCKITDITSRFIKVTS